MTPEEISKKTRDLWAKYFRNEAPSGEEVEAKISQLITKYGQSKADGIEAIFKSFETDLLLWKRVLDNPLKHTKAQKEKAAAYVLILNKVVEDIKSLFPPL